MNNRTYKALHNTGQGGLPCACCRKGLRAMHRRMARRALKDLLRKEISIKG